MVCTRPLIAAGLRGAENALDPGRGDRRRAIARAEQRTGDGAVRIRVAAATRHVDERGRPRGRVRRVPEREAEREPHEPRGRLLDRFLDATFAGSASSLVMQLLGNRKTNQDEIDEIKRIISDMEQNQQP